MERIGVAKRRPAGAWKRKATIDKLMAGAFIDNDGIKDSAATLQDEDLGLNTSSGPGAKRSALLCSFVYGFGSAIIEFQAP